MKNDEELPAIVAIFLVREERAKDRDFVEYGNAGTRIGILFLDQSTQCNSGLVHYNYGSSDLLIGKCRVAFDSITIGFNRRQALENLKIDIAISIYMRRY